MKKQNPFIVDTSGLARIMNLSPRRVQQLVKIGMPKIGRAQFNFVESAGWYVRFLQTAIERKGLTTEDSQSDFRKEKSRTLNASAELKELELAEKRAGLVTREDVGKVFAEFKRMTRARISTVPPKLAADIVSGKWSRNMIQAKIETAFDEAFFVLATVDPDVCAANSFSVK